MWARQSSTRATSTTRSTSTNATAGTYHRRWSGTSRRRLTTHRSAPSCHALTKPPCGSAASTTLPLRPTARSLYFYQFPNPNRVEQKVRGYLLFSRTQEEQKWLAFANHGFLDVGDTALVVASLLSSVFFGDFPSAEIRPTADGALQFTVPVLLQSYRGYLPLTTSWSYRDSSESMNSRDLGDGEQSRFGLATGLWMDGVLRPRRGFIRRAPA